MKGPLARLHRALAQFMLDIHTQEHGYTEVYAPYLVNAASLFGTGQLPKFEEDLFRINRADAEPLYLIPTAEVPVTNIVRDEIRRRGAAAEVRLPYAVLPLGSGLVRQWRHARHDPPAPVRQGRARADRDAGKIARGTRGTDAPRRDHPRAPGTAVPPCRAVHRRHGFSSAKTFDLEVWLPAQNTYREISSCLTFRIFRRAACRPASATRRASRRSRTR